VAADEAFRTLSSPRLSINRVFERVGIRDSAVVEAELRHFWSGKKLTRNLAIAMISPGFS
jgi:hypothetical protein